MESQTLEAPKMSYAEALKKVTAPKKTQENFLLIKVAYDMKIVLPYAAGVLFMQTLNSAEKLSDGYHEQISIGGFERDSITSTLLSGEEYAQIKIAHLLQVKLEEVKKMKLTF